MSVNPHAALAAGEPAGPEADWRLERLVSLMGEDWLQDEWDPERHLVLPRPGGRLTRVQRCVVVHCPSDAHGASPLCARHRRQFAASGTADVDVWVASGEPAALERRRDGNRSCGSGAKNRQVPGDRVLQRPIRSGMSERVSSSCTSACREFVKYRRGTRGVSRPVSMSLYQSPTPA